jgi:hypothetical protein
MVFFRTDPYVSRNQVSLVPVVFFDLTKVVVSPIPLFPVSSLGSAKNGHNCSSLSIEQICSARFSAEVARPANCRRR